MFEGKRTIEIKGNSRLEITLYFFALTDIGHGRRIFV